MTAPVSRLGVSTIAVCCAAVVAVVLAAPGLVATAGAAPEPTDDVARAAVEIVHTDQRLATARDDLQHAEAEVMTTQASLNVTLGEQAVNRARLEVVLERIRERSVVAYQRSGSSTVAPLDVQRVSDLDTARRYAEVASRVDTRDRDALQQVADELERKRAEKQTDHDQWVTQRAELRERVDELAAERARQQAALDRAGAIPVMGDSVLRATQLAAWFRSTGAVPRLAPGTTIDDVAAFYIDEGQAEHVRGDFAFAQAIIETGSFSVAAGNNYSGIGVCDSCTGGYSFSTPRDGVRAQIQLLRNYADPDSSRGPARQPAVPRALRRRRAEGGPPLRHLLPQGQGAALEPDGRRELGDRSHLRGQGRGRLQPDGLVRQRAPGDPVTATAVPPTAETRERTPTASSPTCRVRSTAGSTASPWARASPCSCCSPWSACSCSCAAGPRSRRRASRLPHPRRVAHRRQPAADRRARPAHRHGPRRARSPSPSPCRSASCAALFITEYASPRLRSAASPASSTCSPRSRASSTASGASSSSPNRSSRCREWLAEHFGWIPIFAHRARTRASPARCSSPASSCR